MKETLSETFDFRIGKAKLIILTALWVGVGIEPFSVLFREMLWWPFSFFLNFPPFVCNDKHWYVSPYGALLANAAWSFFIYVSLSIKRPSDENPSTISSEWPGRLLQILLGGVGLLMCFPFTFELNGARSEHALVSFAGWGFVIPFLIYVMFRQHRIRISPPSPRFKLGTFLFLLGWARVAILFITIVLIVMKF
jgi:hypothetical protein